MRNLFIVSNIIVWGLTITIIFVAPPEIPLFYSRIWGEGQVASKWEILLLPILMEVAFIVSNWFAKKKFATEPNFTKLANAILAAQVLIIIGIAIRTLWILSFS